MASPCSLHDLILVRAKANPANPAILAPGSEPLTYQQLADQLHAAALQLTRWGLGPGERVAVVLPNGPEMATAFLAVSSVCTCAPLNPAYTAEEMTFSMQDLGVKALMVSPGGGQAARQAAGRLGVAIIELEPADEPAGRFQLRADLPVEGPVPAPRVAGLEDVALVLHTSGTTSRPKIVPLTQRNLFHSVENIRACYGLRTTDRCLNMMPLFHIHGLMAALAASLVSGGSVICAPGFVPGQVIDWLTRLAPTWYTAVPTIHQAILEQARLEPGSTERTQLRFIRSCSSSLAPQVAQDLETAFGVPVVEAYGMTEASHQIASNPLPPRPRRFGSVGLPTGSTRAAILDEQGKPLPANAVGEICIRGENVIAAYEKNPSANAASFSDGWLRTGDRGSQDDDGYVYIQGRIKELINRGGEKISPREIDEALLRHPAVRQAVAFATPHPVLGEDVAAAVVLESGQAVSMQELRRFAAASLADFKVPRLILFLPEIPKGATGKIQRIGLAEKLGPELAAARAPVNPVAGRPVTSLEAEILSIWQEVLGGKTIDPQDDFFAAGGDSITAARILMLVGETCAVELSLADLFTASTVAAMAGLIEERRAGKPKTC